MCLVVSLLFCALVCVYACVHKCVFVCACVSDCEPAGGHHKQGGFMGGFGESSLSLCTKCELYVMKMCVSVCVLPQAARASWAALVSSNISLILFPLECGPFLMCVPTPGGKSHKRHKR